MQRRNKHFKNIKIYNSNPTSFIELRNTEFFSYFYKQKEYKNLLMEVLINIVRDLNPKDNLTFIDFEELLEIHFEISEINYGFSIPLEIKSKMIKQLYDLYHNDEQKLSKFRGDVVEFLLVYLEKTNEMKIFHEPLFYHKRNKLFRKPFEGSGCLIDVVKLNKRNKNITLIECKADLDVRIRRIAEKKDFKNKLHLMNALENSLSKYLNHQNKYIRVVKSLASIKHPILTLPEEYKDFNFINLYDHFKLMEKNVS